MMAIDYEKACRLTPDHLLRRLFNPPVHQRLVRPSWCSVPQSLIMGLPSTLTSREPLPDQMECPWVSKGHCQVYQEGVANQQAIAENKFFCLGNEGPRHNIHR